MDEILSTETLIIELLLIVSLVAIMVRRLRLPYTVALVVVGLLITFRQPLNISLTPELILSLFVPPLVFEAAFHLDLKSLRESLVSISVLAVPGVLLTTLVVGSVVSAGLGMPLSSALVFGALISATDPVAVVSLFRSLGAPHQLTMLVDGESLFNDGTAIVIFNLVLASALISHGGPETNVLVAAVDFVRVAAGGLVIGVGLGWLTALVISRVDDYLIETTLTTVLAFSAYLLAERAEVSGVLAVVAAGVVAGNFGTQGMSPTTRIVLYSFWEYLAFIANSLVFLLIGLDVNIPQIAANLSLIGVAVFAVLLSRLLVVYGLSALLNLRRRRVPLAYQHILFWGGLRGAIGLALALSLPAALAEREALRVMTFGVVLFTLLIQGTSMSFLMRRLRLVGREPGKLEYERRHGRLIALQAAREHVERQYQVGMYSPDTWQYIRGYVDEKIAQTRAAQQELLAEQPQLRAEELDSARREALRAERATLTTLLSNGSISEPVYEELVRAVDAGIEQRLIVLPDRQNDRLAASPAAPEVAESHLPERAGSSVKQRSQAD
jgi:CPA1 family monovalent cation:H+ antiporter